jgi:hypothetical protein
VIDLLLPGASAFPEVWTGRHPPLRFRDLLRLHSRCGLRTRSTSFEAFFFGASGQAVTHPPRPMASEVYRQFLGRDFHPLVEVHPHGAPDRFVPRAADSGLTHSVL